jgi:hypothetical protein
MASAHRAGSGEPVLSDAEGNPMRGGIARERARSYVNVQRTFVRFMRAFFLRASRHVLASASLLKISVAPVAADVSPAYAQRRFRARSGIFLNPFASLTLVRVFARFVHG